MSFDLGVFHIPKPMSVDDAMALYEAACDDDEPMGEVEPHPAIAKFLKALLAQYPSADDGTDDQTDSSPWTDDLSGSRTCVLISISWSQAAEISPVVAQLALKHGLVCIDPQVGTILTAPWQKISGKSKTQGPRTKKSAGPRPSPKRLRESLGDRLATLGFEPHGDGYFILRKSDDVLGSLNLCELPRQKDIRIQPAITARHRPLAQLCCELKGQPYGEWEDMMLGAKTSMAVLLRGKGKYGCSFRGFWTFRNDSDLEKIGGQFALAIKRYAIPFIDRHDTLQKMAPHFFEGLHEDPDLAPTALFMLRRYDETLDYLETKLAEWEGDWDQTTNDYRSFAKRLIARLGKAGFEIPKSRMAELSRVMKQVPSPF